MLSKEEYRSYCIRYGRVVDYLSSYSDPIKTANLICSLRGYYPERMSLTLQRAGFMFIEDEVCYSKLVNCGDDLGLFKENQFLLAGRFIFPIKDMLGNVIALVGWFPDEKKYITTPSKLFSKSCLYYGLEQFSQIGINKRIVLVEGIFDCLSVRSLGLPCLGMMGIDSSKYKKSLYSLFGSILAIPDNDVEGRKVVSGDLWGLPMGSSYVRWSGSVKDIDAICNMYELEDIRSELLGLFGSSKRVVDLEL